ncbi:MAG: cyclic nucleotide-binding domain-containing protein [Candidatus Nanopelagicales bacterium]|jgi:CRP-like cAMP-binding protein|nr:cyclic nucleotide-binding domain-containing protein [Candidatus Nanopelagicales bacterium]
MATSDLTDVLGSVDLFAGLEPKVLRSIREAGEVTAFPAGTAVLQQGEPVSGFREFSRKGVALYVVLDGSAEVHVGDRAVDVLHPGAYFGELSLIDGLPRSADVIAAVDGLTTFALQKWSFDDLLRRYPDIAIPMLRVLCARLRRAESHD